MSREDISEAIGPDVRFFVVEQFSKQRQGTVEREVAISYLKTCSLSSDLVPIKRRYPENEVGCHGSANNRPFAAYSHMVQKPPCWNARDALEQNKQKITILEQFSNDCRK